MGSHFDRNTNRRNSPAWCKKGMFAGIPEYIDERPTMLGCYALWNDEYQVPPLHVSEYFRLSWNPIGIEWSGESSLTGPHLAVTATPTPGTDMTVIRLAYFDDFGLVDETQWTHRQPTSLKTFDSGLRTRDWIPRILFAQIRILG